MEWKRLLEKSLKILKKRKYHKAFFKWFFGIVSAAGAAVLDVYFCLEVELWPVGDFKEVQNDLGICGDYLADCVRNLYTVNDVLIGCVIAVAGIAYAVISYICNHFSNESLGPFSQQIYEYSYGKMQKKQNWMVGLAGVSLLLLLLRFTVSGTVAFFLLCLRVKNILGESTLMTDRADIGEKLAEQFLDELENRMEPEETVLNYLCTRTGKSWDAIRWAGELGGLLFSVPDQAKSGDCGYYYLCAYHTADGILRYGITQELNESRYRFLMDALSELQREWRLREERGEVFDADRILCILSLYLGVVTAVVNKAESEALSFLAYLFSDQMYYGINRDQKGIFAKAVLVLFESMYLKGIYIEPLLGETARRIGFIRDLPYLKPDDLKQKESERDPVWELASLVSKHRELDTYTVHKAYCRIRGDIEEPARKYPESYCGLHIIRERT